MSMEVLQSKADITAAREELELRGISALSGPNEIKIKRLLARTGVVKPLIMGDLIKSWDVLATISFLEQRIRRDAPVLDIGCFASEVLISLHRAGFESLCGIDLNPKLASMPHSDKIRYVTGNFMATPFADESFAAVTSISVIEHGFDGPRLLKEMARILKPGGVFTASFDFWPEKIDTGDTRFFDMDWLIFSEDDVLALIDEARKHGLTPVGGLNFDAEKKAIEHGGFQYTFGWLALEKKG